MNILINQLGYTPEMTKVAVLRGNLSAEMQVRDAAGQVVMTVPVPSLRTEIWGDQAVQADFSALTAPGVYTLHCGTEAS